MSKKDVIYLDVEDDITAVIDKVKASSAAIIALVPPKRANMLSSVVNLRLLKRAADTEEKKVVLITDEQVLTSMAGGIGMFVATNLTSAPQVPKVNAVDLPSDVIDVDPADVPEPEGKATHEELAGKAAVGASTDKKPEAKKPTKGKKGKPKVPDMNRFRKFIFLGVGILILLLVLLWWMYFVAPRASVTLTAQTTDLALDTPVTLSTQAEEVDVDRNIIPAEKRETSEEVSEDFEATGEKNVGEKATGTMQLTRTSVSSTAISVPAGTRFTSGNLTFVSTEATTLAGTSVGPGGIVQDSKTVPVEASDMGEKYNVSARSYQSSVSGYTSQGSNMAGGTDDIVSVVTAEDVKDAQENIAKDGEKGALNELKAQFDDETMIVIEESIDTERSGTKVTPAVGKEATKGTVEETVTYSLLAISKQDYEEFLDEKLKDELKDEQKLVDYDQEDVRFEPEGDTFTLIARPKAGPNIDTDALAKKLAGKRFSEAVSIAEDQEDVTEARVRLSPFWVFRVTGNPDKIDITIESPSNE